jgi:hypothetical protein
MHLCLSCNQPCNISSIFCEACRISLSECHLDESQEALVEAKKAGTGERLMDFASFPFVGATEVAAQAESEHATLVQQTEDEPFWPGDEPEDEYPMDALEERVVSAQSDHNPFVPLPPPRRTIPKRVRVALVIFCIVGMLAFTVDGVLLALSIMRHHTPHAVANISHTFIPQVQSELRVAATQTASVVSSTISATPSAKSLTATPTSTVSPVNGVLSLSSSSLSFSVSGDQKQADLAPQTVTLSTGEQSAFSWLIGPTSSVPAWLSLSATQGTALLGANAQVAVSVRPAQLAVGTYSAHLVVQAFNSQEQELAQSPHSLDITLSVSMPCSLSASPEKLSFESVLLSNPAAQALALQENGSCAFPATWAVSSDASWVKFSRSSVSDSGAGSTIMVSVNVSGKLVGNYTAQITLQATDANGLLIAGSPITVAVTLTVVLS